MAASSRSRGRGRDRKGSAGLVAYPVWPLALVLLLISLVLIAAGPTVSDLGTAAFLTLAGWILSFIGILLLVEELWNRESGKRRRKREPVTSSISGRDSETTSSAELVRLNEEIRSRDKVLDSLRVKLRQSRSVEAPAPDARGPSAGSPPTVSEAHTSRAKGRLPAKGTQPTPPASSAGPRPPLRAGSALSRMTPVAMSSEPPAQPGGVSLATIPSSADRPVVVAVFVGWNRYTSERSRLLDDLATRDRAETLEFRIEGPNDFHELNEISKVLGYRVAGNLGHAAPGTGLVAVHLRIGEFDESRPAIVLVDNRALWSHAEGMFDRPEDVKSMLASPRAEDAVRGLGVAAIVDRVAFGNDPFSSFLVRELASLVAHNAGLLLPRLVDVIVNRSFVAAGKHVALVEALARMGDGEEKAGDGGNDASPEPVAADH